MDRRAELTGIVLGSPWFTEVLALVAALDLPDCWIGAGAVRDLVWDQRFGRGFDPANVADADVAFFDPDDLTPARELAVERRLSELRPELIWDAKNQARVHLWYEARFGAPVEPLTSTADGIGTWPETATAIGIRLALPQEQDRDLRRPERRAPARRVSRLAASATIEIVAPRGLDDLLDGIWRRNPVRVTDAEYRARLERKQPHNRWPGVTVIDEPLS